MTKAVLGIIGGSGLYDLPGLEKVRNAEGNGGVVRIGVDGLAGAFDDFGQRHGLS